MSIVRNVIVEVGRHLFSFIAEVRGGEKRWEQASEAFVSRLRLGRNVRQQE